MSGREMCLLTLAEQANLLRQGAVSPVEVVGSVLRQIERVDGQLNGYITVTGDAALAEARRAEAEIAKGRYRGPLHGIPIALKDLFQTRGVRTTAGSKILRDFVPAEDATVVERLRAAGAVLVGKLNMHEFAFGTLGTNPHFGHARNPWDPGRITGGSSSGSGVAVAAGMAAGALGSDTGGSIRIPAALCGVTGLKPTYGRVSRHGVIPLSWSMDHVGPLARTAEDAALLLAAIAGWDPKDPTSSREPVPDYPTELARGVSGLSVAVLWEYATDPMDPDVAAGFQRAVDVLRGLGMTVEELSVPEVEYAQAATMAIIWSEGATYHEEHLRSRANDYGPDVRARLETGLLVAATDYLKGQRVRAVLIDRLRSLLRNHNVLVCPTIPIPAPRLDQESVQVGGNVEGRGDVLPRHTRLFNLTGFPAASVPCGFTGDGLPIALEIVGDSFAEGTVLRVAHAYQQATDWHRRVPPLADAPA